jgi:hypothetical protein
MMASYYSSQRYRRERRRGKNRLGFFFIAIALFFAGVVWFRSAGTKRLLSKAETPIDFLDVEQVGEETAPVAREREEVRLKDATDGSSWGVADRVVEGKTFQHTVIATLPAVSDEFVYEGWLVREYPFDFFSTGQLMPRADGTFFLVWQGPLGEDFETYVKVVITREPQDDDPSPFEHVLEGEF